MRRLPSLPVPLLAFVLCAAFAVVVGILVLHGSDDQSDHVTVLGRRVALTKQESYGHEVFAQHCASCHQLAASDSAGMSGPNLDAVSPTAAEVQQIVVNGKVGAGGVMDSGLAAGPQVAAVANYVSRVANRNAYHP